MKLLAAVAMAMAEKGSGKGPAPPSKGAGKGLPAPPAKGKGKGRNPTYKEKQEAKKECPAECTVRVETLGAEQVCQTDQNCWANCGNVCDRSIYKQSPDSRKTLNEVRRNTLVAEHSVVGEGETLEETMQRMVGSERIFQIYATQDDEKAVFGLQDAFGKPQEDIILRSAEDCATLPSQSLNLLAFRSYRTEQSTKQPFEHHLLNANSGGVQWLVNSNRISDFGGDSAYIAGHLIKVQCPTLFNNYVTCNQGKCWDEKLDEKGNPLQPSSESDYHLQFGAVSKPSAGAAWFSSPNYVQDGGEGEPFRPVDGVEAFDRLHLQRHGWQHVVRVGVWKELDFFKAWPKRSSEGVPTDAAGVRALSRNVLASMGEVKSLTDWRMDELPRKQLEQLRSEPLTPTKFLMRGSARTPRSSRPAVPRSAEP